MVLQMDDKTKRLIFFIGSLFVAIIFLTSYAAFNNNNTTGGTTTSTIANVNTVPVVGSANGIIVNYTDVAHIYLGNGSNATIINTTLNALEANGTISNYVGTNKSYDVLLNSIDPYSLYKLIRNETKNVSVGGQAEILLPAKVDAYYSTSGIIPITLPTRNYTLFLNNTKPIGSQIPVKITAIVTENGTIYNNNIKIQEVQS